MAGRMSARGRRSGSCPSATPPAMRRMVRRPSSSTRAAPMWPATSSSSRCSASTMWSWSRPTMPCWWRGARTATACGGSCSKLKEVAPAVTEEHLKVHRPWGSYQSLDQGERFQVKRIVVKQGGRLSLQLHHHRAEHWVVVRGTARVTIGDEVKILHENESIYIPSGAAASPGKSRQDRSRTDRGADRQLSRRGRHRPHRGRLSPVVIPPCVAELGHTRSAVSPTRHRRRMDLVS